MKRILGFITALLLLAGAVFPICAKDDSHIIINQVYGASDDGYADHSFIELYNPGSSAVSLMGWSVQYRSSKDGDHSDAWYVLKLSGTIEAGGYYLIRCGAAAKAPASAYKVPQGNAEWDTVLHNKGLSVALLSTDTQLSDSFSGDITAEGFVLPAGFVDLAAVQGNDKTASQTPPAYEGAYSAIQSKKKAIRRKGFADTDNNSADFEAVDYSKTVSADKGPHAGDAAPEPGYTPAETGTKQYTGFFDEGSQVKAKLLARYNSGASSGDGGSAEITAYNPVNRFAYSVNGVKGTLVCIDMRGIKNGSAVTPLSAKELKAADLAAGVDESFHYGDMTSAAVSPDGRTLAVAMQDADYTKRGRVLFFSCSDDGSLTYEGISKTGVQPDMVTFTQDGKKVLTADEGEPRRGYTEAGAVDPLGSVTVIDTETKASVTVDFTKFDSKRDEMCADGIVLKKGTAPSADLEPEYIAVCGGKAYVALQEANAVAVLDIDSLQFENIFSLGFENHSSVAIDLDKSDGTYNPKTYENVKGIRMPDGIAAAVIDGETYLLAANEGDSRVWPADTETDTNEIKSKTSPVGGISVGGKVTWFDVSQYDGLEAGVDYVFGGRSFTVYKIENDGLTEVFDSGSDFERITASVLGSRFNCSNYTVEAEDRSGKKGPEPENVTVGTADGHTYAIIGLERIGGVMIYDITDPANAAFKNYFNSRDYSADIRDDVSPEGLLFVDADKNASGLPLIIASNEVSGTVSVAGLDIDTTPPEILNVEDGKTYYVTKKVVVYNDDETPVSVTLNGEAVEDVFFLPGDREAAYTIVAKDTAGNEASCTVHIKPLSEIAKKLAGLTENTVTSSDADTVTETEKLLLDVAGAFDEEESTEEEWNTIKDTLELCNKLDIRIAEVKEKLDALRTAVKSYAGLEIGSEDRTGIEKLVADAKELLSTDNLTAAEREETEGLMADAKGLIAKLDDGDKAPEPDNNSKSDNDDNHSDIKKPAADTDKDKTAEKPATVPQTGDRSAIVWMSVMLACIAAITVLFIIRKKTAKR